MNTIPFLLLYWSIITINRWYIEYNKVNWLQTDINRSLLSNNECNICLKSDILNTHGFGCRLWNVSIYAVYVTVNVESQSPPLNYCTFFMPPTPSTSHFDCPLNASGLAKHIFFVGSFHEQTCRIKKRKTNKQRNDKQWWPTAKWY